MGNLYAMLGGIQIFSNNGKGGQFRCKIRGLIYLFFMMTEVSNSLENKIDQWLLLAMMTEFDHIKVHMFVIVMELIGFIFFS